MTSRAIKTEDDRADVVALISHRELPFTVSIKKGSDRSLQQNNLMWEWNGQISAQLGDMTPQEIHEQNKLTIGVPILRAENPEFRDFYDAVVKGRTYEEKLRAMRWIDVTSIMTVKQMTAFLDTVLRTYSEQGVRLPIPEERW